MVLLWTELRKLEDILLDNSSQIYYDLSNTTEEVTGDEMARTR